MTYFEELNEKIVELYTLLKWHIITQDQFNTMRNNISLRGKI